MYLLTQQIHGQELRYCTLSFKCFIRLFQCYLSCLALALTLDWLILCMKNEGRAMALLASFGAQNPIFYDLLGPGLLYLVAVFSSCTAYITIFQIRLIILAKSLEFGEGESLSSLLSFRRTFLVSLIDILVYNQ